MPAPKFLKQRPGIQFLTVLYPGLQILVFENVKLDFRDFGDPGMVEILVKTISVSGFLAGAFLSPQNSIDLEFYTQFK